MPLDGAANARDLGDLPTDDGARTARHRLLRSDNLQGLTPGDVRLLVDGIGLRTVVDLRTDVEVALEGPGPLTREPEVEIRHLTLFPESGHRTDVDADAVLPWQHNGEDERRRSARATGCRIRTARRSRSISATCGTGRTTSSRRCGRSRPRTARRSCTARPARTAPAWSIALALSVAGVPRDRIVADYAATGERMTPLLARLKSSDDLPRGPRQPAGRLAPAAGGDDGGASWPYLDEHVRRARSAGWPRPGSGRRTWPGCGPGWCRSAVAVQD